MLTLPACRQTIVGPAGRAASVRSRSATSIAPLRSAATGSSVPSPRPEQTQRAVDRGVALLAGDDTDRGAADQPVALDVPADVGEDVVAPGGEADGVGLLGAGDEPDRGSGRQPEQLLEPRPGDLLGRRRGRRQHGREGVLVPPGREDLGRGRRVQRPADDEAEVARPDRGDQSRLDGSDEGVEHVVGRRPVDGELAAETSTQHIRIGGGRHGPLRNRLTVGRGDRRRPCVQPANVDHRGGL